MEAADNAYLLKGRAGRIFRSFTNAAGPVFRLPPPVKGGNRIAKIAANRSAKLRVALGYQRAKGLPCPLVGSKTRTTDFGGFG